MTDETLVPKQMSTSDLAKQLSEQAAEARKRLKLEAGKLPKGECYAIGCNRNHKHRGIFFAEGVHPTRNALIHVGMWFASYHEIGQANISKPSDVICSECLAETGERQVLRTRAVAPPDPAMGYCFTIPMKWKRFIHKIGAGEMRKILGKPEPEPNVVEAKSAGASTFEMSEPKTSAKAGTEATNVEAPAKAKTGGAK